MCCSFLKISLLILCSESILSRSIRNSSDVETEDDGLSKRMNIFESTLKNMSEAILKVTADKEHEKKMPIFFVRLSSTITLQTYSIVKFDELIIDEGDNFNSGDGIFIAPVSGLYFFSWTIQQYQNRYAYTELRVDNVVKATLNVLLANTEFYNTATRIMFCKVQKGNHVWIQTRGDNTGNYFHSFNGSKTSFMGFLVKQT